MENLDGKCQAQISGVLETAETQNISATNYVYGEDE